MRGEGGEGGAGFKQASTAGPIIARLMRVAPRKLSSLGVLLPALPSALSPLRAPALRGEKKGN